MKKFAVSGRVMIDAAEDRSFGNGRVVTKRIGLCPPEKTLTLQRNRVQFLF